MQECICRNANPWVWRTEVTWGCHSSAALVVEIGSQPQWSSRLCPSSTGIPACPVVPGFFCLFWGVLEIKFTLSYLIEWATSSVGPSQLLFLPSFLSSFLKFLFLKLGSLFWWPGAVVALDCRLGGIWGQLGDLPLDESMRAFPEGVNWGKRTLPQSGQYLAMVKRPKGKV